MQSIGPGVPLDHYRQHRGGVTLMCLDCMNHRTFDLEAVIARLAVRGVGGAQTGIKAAITTADAVVSDHVQPLRLFGPDLPPGR